MFTMQCVRTVQKFHVPKRNKIPPKRYFFLKKFSLFYLNFPGRFPEAGRFVIKIIKINLADIVLSKFWCRPEKTKNKK